MTTAAPAAKLMPSERNAGDAPVPEAASASPAPNGRVSAGRAIGSGLLFLLIYFVVQLLVSVPYVIVVTIRTLRETGFAGFDAFFAHVLERTQSAGPLLTGVTDLCLLGAFALTLALMKRPIAEALRLSRVPAGRLLLLVPLGLSLNLFLTSLISLLPANVLQGYMEAAGQVLPDGYGVFTVLLVVLLAPLTEEVLFRALLFGSFRRGLTFLPAALLAAALFGLMHAQPLWMLYTAVFGMLLCLLMERQGSLVGCVVLHAAFNAGSFLVLLLQSIPLSVVLVCSGAIFALLLHAVFAIDAPMHERKP